MQRNDAMAAVEFADRRCRISPPPSAHSHVLRGDALYRAGDLGGAVSALEQALTLAPEDLAANRRMLAWATGEASRDAAAVLVRVERDMGTLRLAIERLRGEGRRHFASCSVLEDEIDGWALCDGAGPAVLTISEGADSRAAILQGAASADFPALGDWIRFRVRRPKSSLPQSLVITVDGEIIHSQEAIAAHPLKRGASPLRSQDRCEVGLTVVVPIYGDLDATRACLESLTDELERAPELQAILIDDASPDSQIVELANRLAGHPRIRVLTNARNLGFVGAVNRALELVTIGDVLLLNADALPPRGFTARLAEAARSAPDIGLVMPLSNNGDLASFPLPYAASALGSRAEIEAIDRIASRVNRGLVIDIPNGIGFCLYITRACLTAIDRLCEDFDRGYLEDVDLSLRARARGLRTVCAPSVYVGHAGSKSFGAGKRALVVRNAAIVHSRYPGYSLEFVAFAAADPLREARQAIHRQMPLRPSSARLLVAGSGVVGEVTRARARRLSGAQPVLFLEVRNRANGSRVILTSLREDDALAAEFDMSSPLAMRGACRPPQSFRRRSDRIS